MDTQKCYNFDEDFWFDSVLKIHSYINDIFKFVQLTFEFDVIHFSQIKTTIAYFREVVGVLLTPKTTFGKFLSRTNFQKDFDVI
jgi:hypothetical protein